MFNYQEHYEKLLETLAKDNRPWRPASTFQKMEQRFISNVVLTTKAIRFTM